MILSILDGVIKSVPRNYPFRHLNGSVSINNESVEEYRNLFPKREPYIPPYPELGRTITYINGSSFWRNELSEQVTHELIGNLIEKLNPPSYFEDGVPVWDKTCKLDYEYDWNFVEDFGGQSEEEGWGFPPHTDAVSKMLSLLIPLSNKVERSKFSGTSIYESKNGVTSYNGERLDFKDFNEIYEYPHKAGNFTAIPKLINSWHGVRPMVTLKGESRKTIILMVRRK